MTSTSHTPSTLSPLPFKHKPKPKPSTQARIQISPLYILHIDTDENTMPLRPHLNHNPNSPQIIHDPTRRGCIRGVVARGRSCGREHSPYWHEASKFLVSTHEQVQLLAAEAIPSHLSPTTSGGGTSLPKYLSGGLLPTPNPLPMSELSLANTNVGNGPNTANVNAGGAYPNSNGASYSSPTDPGDISTSVDEADGDAEMETRVSPGRVGTGVGGRSLPLPTTAARSGMRGSMNTNKNTNTNTTTNTPTRLKAGAVFVAIPIPGPVPVTQFTRGCWDCLIPARARLLARIRIRRRNSVDTLPTHMPTSGYGYPMTTASTMTVAAMSGGAGADIDVHNIDDVHMDDMDDVHVEIDDMSLDGLADGTATGGGKVEDELEMKMEV
ncbi:hypothetical protein BU17DRAFT_65346 [Hysterangium stoloniferum]|nr:hypothetical protein BU17DRAFT_65346 [Hysterangium stoloniferum]